MSAATDRWREAVRLNFPGPEIPSAVEAGDALATLLDRIERVADEDRNYALSAAEDDVWERVLRIIREEGS